MLRFFPIFNPLGVYQTAIYFHQLFYKVKIVVTDSHLLPSKRARSAVSHRESFSTFSDIGEASFTSSTEAKLLQPVFEIKASESSGKCDRSKSHATGEYRGLLRKRETVFAIAPSPGLIFEHQACRYTEQWRDGYGVWLWQQCPILALVPSKDTVELIRTHHE